MGTDAYRKIILVMSHVYATHPRYACALAQAHPTMVHLYLHWIAVNRNLSEELDL